MEVLFNKWLFQSEVITFKKYVGFVSKSLFWPCATFGLIDVV